MKKNIWEEAAMVAERGMDFDTSDTPQEPVPPKRKGPPPVPVRRNPALANKGHSYNPGMPPRKDEVGQPRRRADTIPLPTNYKSPGIIDTGVTNPEDPRFQNAPEYQAATPARRQSMPTRQIPIRREGVSAANGAGFQAPMGDAGEAAKRVYYKEALDQVFMETVRKLPNGKYGVYLKNKGKKKAPKKVGEYPDKIAAREAEVARGGKSGEAAKKEREKLNRLKKDPKKLAAAKAKDKRKTRKESIINAMVDGLNEALFREEDVPGSTWDERLAGLSPTALASNKRLAGHTKNIHKASVSSLMDAQKLLAKALKKHGKVIHGDLGTETGGKMYLPCTLQGKGGEEQGPIYLYVDGGHVKMEMADEMNEALDGMDEGEGHALRGALMAFAEKQLPKLDGARIAYANRDKDLDKMEKEHDDELSGRDGLSLHLLKHLIGVKHGRRYR